MTLLLFICSLSKLFNPFLVVWVLCIHIQELFLGFSSLFSDLFNIKEFFKFPWIFFLTKITSFLIFLFSQDNGFLFSVKLSLVNGTVEIVSSYLSNFISGDEIFIFLFCFI